MLWKVVEMQPSFLLCAPHLATSDKKLLVYCGVFVESLMSLMIQS